MDQRDSKEARQLIFSVTIHDCEVQTFRCGGHGGQNVNKVSTGVRVIHHPSGARGEGRETRSQLQNKRSAFLKMAAHPKFKVWLNRRLWHGTIASEEKARRDMAPGNLRVEGKKDGRWVPIEQAQQ
jgi:protein subunit release factor A